MKNIKLYVVLAALMGSVFTLAGYRLLEKQQTYVVHPVGSPGAKVQLTSVTPNSLNTPADFTFASEQTLPKVVHIKIVRNVKSQAFNPFGNDRQLPDDFRQFFQPFFGNPFGQGQQGEGQQEFKEEGAGSGVIISPDGYIVTNNHVAGDANEIEVSLYDKRTFKAKLIGKDPSTDLALLKIEAKDLPFVTFANSDAIKVGQWVVAVGNPFNLESTVTAGIVSAKGRSININTDKAPIEAFIQTDAAVNPGNSGGALVNLEGELVGINSAIASPTGAYAGYAFAVPSNLVSKVVDDLRQYGVAQRAFLGAKIRTLDGNFAKEKELGINRGVWIEEVNAGSAAEQAGLQKGDIITAMDGQPVNESPALIEQIGRHRPGDKVEITYIRNGKTRTTDVTLRNASGNTGKVTKMTSTVLETLGADFKPLSNEELDKMNLSHGVRVEHLRNGKLRQAGIREGFVISKINNQPVSSEEDVQRILEETESNGGILLEGKYKGDDRLTYLGFGL